MSTAGLYLLNQRRGSKVEKVVGLSAISAARGPVYLTVVVRGERCIYNTSSIRPDAVLMGPAAT